MRFCMGAVARRGQGLAVLSERQLARGFADAWRCWTPHLDARLLASLRPDGTWQEAAQQWAPPLQATAPAKHNDAVAEIAFGLFCAELEEPAHPLEAFPVLDVEPIIEDALSRVALLRRGVGLVREDIGAEHLADARAMATRLRDHLGEQDGTPRVHERLEGAGVLAACHPDIMQGSTLVEVKMSKTGFRSADLRQLLVYAAMAHWNGIPAKELALVNPRLGLSWRFGVDELVERVADTTPDALFKDIERFVSEELLAW
jgi:hypothetical protein